MYLWKLLCTILVGDAHVKCYEINIPRPVAALQRYDSFFLKWDLGRKAKKKWKGHELWSRIVSRSISPWILH